MNDQHHHPGDDELQSLLDGVVSVHRRRQLVGHLDRCPACLERVSAFRLLFNGLDRLEQGPGPDPGPAFAGRVMAAISTAD